MIPIVSVVGKSGVGKTTFSSEEIELDPELGCLTLMRGGDPSEEDEWGDEDLFDEDEWEEEL